MSKPTKIQSAGYLREALDRVRLAVRLLHSGELAAPDLSRLRRVDKLRYAPHFACGVGKDETGAVPYTLPYLGRVTDNMATSEQANFFLTLAMDMLSAEELGLIDDAFVESALRGIWHQKHVALELRKRLEQAQPSNATSVRLFATPMFPPTPNQAR